MRTISQHIQRLTAKARTNDKGCTLAGRESSQRYWCIEVDGRKMGAHRAAWINRNGPVPDGLQVCHKCDEARCINTDHLFLGTMADNMHDRDRKNRHGNKGSKAFTAKLNELVVPFIRTSNLKVADLARMFGVAEITIWRTRTGYSWSHVNSPTPHAEQQAA